MSFVCSFLCYSFLTMHIHDPFFKQKTAYHMYQHQYSDTSKPSPTWPFTQNPGKASHFQPFFSALRIISALLSISAAGLLLLFLCIVFKPICGGQSWTRCVIKTSHLQPTEVWETATCLWSYLCSWLTALPTQTCQPAFTRNSEAVERGMKTPMGHWCKKHFWFL